MIFQRYWAMPSADTFDCEPIGSFVQKYLLKSKVSVDPFARNRLWATHTNDINPSTRAKNHMDARAFLKDLHLNGTVADLLILDPPYSPRQITEQYKQANLLVNGKDTQNSVLYSECREWFRKISSPDATVLSFGWNSAGMGKGWEIMEILLVCHGGAHNDTICMAERKIKDPQMEL